LTLAHFNGAVRAARESVNYPVRRRARGTTTRHRSPPWARALFRRGRARGGL